MQPSRVVEPRRALRHLVLLGELRAPVLAWGTGHDTKAITRISETDPDGGGGDRYDDLTSGGRTATTT